jgi:hypothetical protein
MITKYYVDSEGNYLGAFTSAPSYTIRTTQPPIIDPKTGEETPQTDLVETVTTELVPPTGGVEVTSPPPHGSMIWNGSAWTYPEAMLIEHLAATRWAYEVVGITHNGMEIATDRESQGKILAARVAAVGDNTYSLVWKAGNGFFTLDAAAIVAMSDAVGEHVRKAFVAEGQATVGVNDGTLTTPDEVDTAFTQALANL